MVQAATKRIAPRVPFIWLYCDERHLCWIFRQLLENRNAFDLQTGKPRWLGLVNPQTVIVPHLAQDQRCDCLLRRLQGGSKKRLFSAAHDGFSTVLRRASDHQARDGVLALNEKQSRLLKPSAASTAASA